MNRERQGFDPIPAILRWNIYVHVIEYAIRSFAAKDKETTVRGNAIDAAAGNRQTRSRAPNAGRWIVTLQQIGHFTGEARAQSAARHVNFSVNGHSREMVPRNRH